MRNRGWKKHRSREEDHQLDVAESRFFEAAVLGTHATLGRAHVDRPAVIVVYIQRHKKEPSRMLRSTLYSLYYTISGHPAALLPANTVATRRGEGGAGRQSVADPLGAIAKVDPAGCEIVAVELGADLAAVAQRKLARFPAVTVVVSAFEDWPLPAEPFDAVLSATAFHWIDPAVRVTKVADALRPQGAATIITTHHIAGGDEDFFVDVQECYERWDPATPPGLRLPTAEQIPSSGEEFTASGLFADVVARRYEYDVTYSTSAYLDVLLTYSGHRDLPEEARSSLLTCIGNLIEAKYGGQVTKRYLNELQVARRRPMP